MTFKLTLRSGVKFSDGTPYDAAAVVKNFQRIMDPKNRCRCVSDLSTIDSVEATGPLEVAIKMKSPSAHFPATLADVAGMVVSPAAAEKYGADFGNYGIGAGAVQAEGMAARAQVIFERNPDYWRKPLYLDEVVLRPMPDEQTRYASLKAGNLDIVINAAARDVLDAQQARRSQGPQPRKPRDQLHPDQPGSAGRFRYPRAAGAGAMRSIAIVLNKALNRGLYKIANTPFGTGLFPHEQVDGYPAYDPAKAKKLVEEYGKPVKVKLTINASPQTAGRRRPCSKCGRRSASRPRSCQWNGAKPSAGRERAIIRQCCFAGPAALIRTRTCTRSFIRRARPISSPQRSGDGQAARRWPNHHQRGDRLKIYRQINNMLAKDLPYLFLWYFDNIALANPAVKGLTPVPDGLLRMHSVWKNK